MLSNRPIRHSVIPISARSTSVSCTKLERGPSSRGIRRINAARRMDSCPYPTRPSKSSTRRLAKTSSRTCRGRRTTSSSCSNRPTTARWKNYRPRRLSSSFECSLRKSGSAVVRNVWPIGGISPIRSMWLARRGVMVPSVLLQSRQRTVPITVRSMTRRKICDRLILFMQRSLLL